MRVFVTGATGYLGSALVPELIGAGHDVVGPARSESSAAKLEALDAQSRRGALDDLDGLRQAAAEFDGIIHLAFDSDRMMTGDFLGAVSADVAAVEALGEALVGSGKPFVGTSGTLMLVSLDRTGTEHDFPDVRSVVNRADVNRSERGCVSLSVAAAVSLTSRRLHHASSSSNGGIVRRNDHYRQCRASVRRREP